MKNLLIAVISCLIATMVIAQDSILVQSTTSTANSGLYDYLLPEFTKEHNTQVHVVAVGTGQAIKNASNCDADVLLVHDKNAEQKFIVNGFGLKRHDLMYNDFVLIGPAHDPADVLSSTTAVQALKKIAASQSVFTSRGDNSGTHKKELGIWAQVALDTKPYSGKWYRETGSGMGATLNTSIAMNAYTLTDRATWISFKNRQKHKILFEGDPVLFNQYGVILVSQEKCPGVNSVAGQKFIDWLTGKQGQQLIADYKLRDQQLFYPNANR